MSLWREILSIGKGGAAALIVITVAIGTVILFVAAILHLLEWH